MGNPTNPRKNPYESDEETLSWEEEANAVINDIQGHVKEVVISRSLPSTSLEIYINVQTLEESKYCIRASTMGFQIVGNSYDNREIYEARHSEDYPYCFETPYSLLASISKEYNVSFATELSSKLENL